MGRLGQGEGRQGTEMAASLVPPELMAAARERCRLTCRAASCLEISSFCGDWREYLPVRIGLEIATVAAKYPDGFDVVAGAAALDRKPAPVVIEPAIEAPRPPAWPVEHPAVAVTAELQRASALDRQRRDAARLLCGAGVSGEEIETAVAFYRDGLGRLSPRRLIGADDVREIVGAVLAAVLA